jgi:hypothetical protein
MLPGKVNKSRIKRLSGVGVGRVLFVKAVFRSVVLVWRVLKRSMTNNICSIWRMKKWKAKSKFFQQLM